jgi:A/G-specific adenine glycosylase
LKKPSPSAIRRARAGDAGVPPDPEFAARVIAWQRRHGRHALPWQNTRDPYRIWVSEIMLQQTQVAAVIGYYGRFTERFPDVTSLGQADVSEVLAHWSGLGYYSRARNLHRAARMVMEEFGGAFPATQEALASLPGIGRATAAAVAAFAYGARAAILDGNVKRVFARHFGIEGYPAAPKVEAAMWVRAEALLPVDGVEAYTQGLMDLGATLCSRSRPRCEACPLSQTCVALRDGRTAELPHRKPRKEQPRRTCVMLLIVDDGKVLLERRPPAGIWGGLLCLPQCDDMVLAASTAQALGAAWERRVTLPVIEHGFTHYHLTIQPLRMPLGHCRARLAAEPHHEWLPLLQAQGAGLPAPVKKLLQSMCPGPLFDQA